MHDALLFCAFVVLNLLIRPSNWAAEETPNGKSGFA